MGDREGEEYGGKNEELGRVREERKTEWKIG